MRCLLGLAWIAFDLGCGGAAGTQQTASPRPARPVVRVEPAEAAEPAPSGPPELRLATAMHAGPINDAAVDAAERFVVTGSDDKTARVWRVSDGALVQTLRLPIEGAAEGMVYVVAITPDAREVAVGGYTKALFMFRLEDGRLRQRIDLPSGVGALAFAPDGAHLVAGLWDGGIRAYAPQDGRYEEVARDSDYADAVYGVAFDRAGRLATASLDRKVRLYDAMFARTAMRELGHRPFRLAFSPDGQRLAVGSRDGPYVELLAADLTPLAYHDLSAAGVGSLGKVAWVGAAGSERLIAGGAFGGSDGLLPLWSAGTGDPSYLTGLTDSTVGALVPLSGGALIVASMEPKLTRLDAAARVLWTHERPIADLRDQTFGLTPDGRHVRFGLGSDRAQPVVFPPLEGSQAAATWQPPRAEGLAISGWKNTEHPTLDGRPLELDRSEMSRSLAIATDAKRFALGTEWWLRMYSNAGVEQWRQAAPSATWTVNLSSDGRLLVAGFGDGTVRWYRAADGTLLLSFFHHARNGQWVAWTPEGFFDASENGEELIGYHFNRGGSGTPVFIGVGQLRAHFHRPDLVAASLEPDRSELDRALAEVGDVAAAVALGLPPRIEVIGGEMRGDTLHLRYRLHDQGGGIGTVRFRINGTLRRPIEGARTVGPQAPQGAAIYEQPLSLPPGQNLVAILAPNAAGNLESVPAELEVRVAEAPRPVLHVLAIGITNYDDHALRKGVRFAAGDAQRVADALRSRAGRLYAGVDVTVLPDATRTQIENAFARLASKSVVAANDVFVLYLAGHGLAPGGNYLFVPRDAVYENDTVMAARSLDERSLAGLLASVPATKSLVLLDSCHAGAALATRSAPDKAGIARLMRITGRATIAASTDEEYAVEGIDGKSAFAHVLLQAIGGAANRKGSDGEGDDWVDIDELSAYLMEQVPRQTFQRFNFRQYPMRETHGGNFPVTDATTR